jgi:hypothetical protein
MSYKLSVVICSWRLHEHLFLKMPKNETYMKNDWNFEEEWQWQEKGNYGSPAPPKHQKHPNEIHGKTIKKAVSCSTNLYQNVPIFFDLVQL